MKALWASIGSAVLGTASVAAAAAPASAPFEKSTAISAPDDSWDFASWDAAHGVLLVAHGRDVLVIDPAHPQALRAIGALQGARGVLAIPGTNDILVSSAKDNTVRRLDEAIGNQIASIVVADHPDALALSPDGHLAYVMAAKAGAISIVDLARNAEIGRIPLQPGLEVPVLVTPALIAVNNEDKSEIELADLASRKALAPIALDGCEGPTGLAIDPESGLALSACDNGKAALVDLRARRLVQLVPIGLGPDTVIWDKAHHRFLVPCGKSGTLDVVSLAGRGATVEASVPTEPSARTAALDPASGVVYLPAASFGPPTEPGKRGPIIAGTFHIVVMKPKG